MAGRTSKFDRAGCDDAGHGRIFSFERDTPHKPGPRSDAYRPWGSGGSHRGVRDWSRRLSRKPFLPKELLLRVGAILNRAYPKQNEMVELDGATVDMANAEVWKNGEKQTLTAKEMQLFEKLYQNAGRIVTTGILCETICGEFWQGYESTLSTHIRHLREKIEENPSKPVSLVTVKGLGYRLNLKGVSP